MPQRRGQACDAAQEERREQEVVRAAILVDGACGGAQRAAQSEAEGLGQIAIEHRAGIEREDRDVLADLVREAGLGGEERGG